MNENDGTTTSSPGPTPSRCSIRCSAVVHEETATACRGADVRGERLLELGHPRPLGHPAGADDLGDGRRLLLAQQRLHHRDHAAAPPIALRHHLTSPRRPSSRPISGDQPRSRAAAPMSASRRVTPLTARGRAELHRQVRVHRGEQRPGQVQQAGLGRRWRCCRPRRWRRPGRPGRWPGRCRARARSPWSAGRHRRSAAACPGRCAPSSGSVPRCRRRGRPSGGRRR